MGEQRQLVCGVVERDQFADRPACLEEVTEAAVGENALEKVVAQPRIVEPPFVLNRQVRELFKQCLREQADAATLAGSAAAVDPDPRHAAARRILLQHVAAEVLTGERVRFLRPSTRSLRPCGRCRFYRAQPDDTTLVDEPDRLAGSAHPVSTSGQTFTHSTSGPSPLVRNASRLWPPS